jgi:spectrin beta
MRIHCLENVDKALTFLSSQRVHLENMGAHDIVDGNPRLTLGLIWTIILRFQVPILPKVTNICNYKYVLLTLLM